MKHESLGVRTNDRLLLRDICDKPYRVVCYEQLPLNSNAFASFARAVEGTVCRRWNTVHFVLKCNLRQ